MDANKYIIACVENFQLPSTHPPANLVREKPLERPAIGHCTWQNVLSNKRVILPPSSSVENALQSKQMLSLPKKLASSFHYDTVGIYTAWQDLAKIPISYLVLLLICILQKNSCILENFLKSCKACEFSNGASLSKLLLNLWAAGKKKGTIKFHEKYFGFSSRSDASQFYWIMRCRISNLLVVQYSMIPKWDQGKFCF